MVDRNGQRIAKRVSFFVLCRIDLNKFTSPKKKKKLHDCVVCWLCHIRQNLYARRSCYQFHPQKRFQIIKKKKKSGQTTKNDDCFFFVLVDDAGQKLWNATLGSLLNLYYPPPIWKMEWEKRDRPEASKDKKKKVKMCVYTIARVCVSDTKDQQCWMVG